MAYLLTAVLSYLVGSISMAYILARARHVDLKKTGSGNLGASNATILLGWRVGVTVAVHDVLKALLCVAVTRILMPEDEYIGAIAGVSCVLGHIYPFYLRFRGGKGFASFVGMTIALNWKVALAVVILALIVTVVTDYIAIATVTTSVVVPIGMGIVTQNVGLTLILLIATAVMLLKHRDNYVRIRNGTEKGLRGTLRGEGRMGK